MLRFESDAEARCFVVRGSGNLSNEDLHAFVDEVRSMPEAVQHPALYDLSQVEHISGLTPDVLMSLSVLQSCDRDAAARQRVAIVVRGAGLYGMARILQAFMGGRLPKLRVFRSVSPALEHLGVDPRIAARLAL